MIDQFILWRMTAQAGSYKSNYDTKKVATYKFGVYMHFNSQSGPYFNVKPTIW